MLYIYICYIYIYYIYIYINIKFIQITNFLFFSEALSMYNKITNENTDNNNIINLNSKILTE